MSFHQKWYIMTSVMILCLITCSTLLILQNRAYNYHISKSPNTKLNKRELYCLYGLFILGAICGIECFICHASMILPKWICIYGFPACVIYYAATKAFLYGFFLERAKCVRKYVKFKYSDLMYDRLLPVYIGLYFLIYLILAPTFFRGTMYKFCVFLHTFI